MVILNMADDLDRRGGKVDVEELSRQLGTSVALISASQGAGLQKVNEFLSGATLGLKPKPPLMQLPIIQDVPKSRDWASNIGRKASYRAPAPPIWTRRLDAIFLHPVAGPLVFLMVVIGVFQTIFAGARPLMDGVQDAIQVSGKWMSGALPDNAFRSLMIDGVWSGVGSVVVFLPQILLLFLFIGILEDSGYLARAALIADRTMARIGLQGQSFIPLLSAYACAVPAIMATRTIENKRDRIATILIAPFMTCSARLPVYTLVIAAFIPERPLLGHSFGTRAAALLGLYVLGFLAAIVTARLLKSTVLKSDACAVHVGDAALPLAHSALARTAAAGSLARFFCARAGTVILGVAIVLWVLSNLPLARREAAGDRAQLRGMIGPCRGTGDPAARIQLEDRDRPDYVARGARSDHRNARHHLRHRRNFAMDRIAGSPAARSDAWRRGGVAGVFRFCDAMHVHDRGGAPGNRRLALAGHSVRLYDRVRLRFCFPHESIGFILFLVQPSTAETLEPFSS